MVKLFLSLSFLLSSVMVMAQANDKAIEDAVAEQVALYQLDRDQEVKMTEIQARRFKNLAEVEPLREQSRRLYLQKLRTIRLSTESSTKAILNQDQLHVYQEAHTKRRVAESETIKQMQKEGASQEEILMALLEMEL